MFRQKTVQNQKTNDNKSDKRPTDWLRGTAMTALLLVPVALIFVMIRFYYVELDN